jgi:transposase
MNYLYFIGIDVSKDTLDVAVFNGSKLLYHVQISNDMDGLRGLSKKMKSLQDFSIRQAVFCMEHTGIYNQHVLNFLQQMQADVCLESAVHIKYSIGLQRGKNDKIDAIRIGQYAYDKREKLKLWKPQREVVQQLSHLAGLRNRLIGSKNQLTVPINEVKPFNNRAGRQMEKLSSASVRALDKDIEKTNKAIQEVIASDPELKRLFAIVTSVDGIGKVTAVQMIITTREFTTITEPAKFACYAGVAPFSYTSGTTLKGKMRVSHRANKTMKTLLHMCAVSAIHCDSDMKLYYQRKLEENKHKMSVLNAVRNKLIWRVFACVRDNRLYQNKYEQALV